MSAPHLGITTGVVRLRTRGGKFVTDIPIDTFAAAPQSVLYSGVRYERSDKIECGEDLILRYCYVASPADFLGTFDRAPDVCVAADEKGVYITMTWKQAACLATDMLAAYNEGLLSRDATALLKGLEMNKVRERSQ